MADFNLTKMAVNLYCPGNVVQLDDAGLPSLLVWIPAFKLSEVLNTDDDSVHPAFIVNDRQIPGFYYSKYENVVHNGKAYSLPAEDPATLVSFHDALEYCEGKGYGWHLSTAAEWAAIALWCKANGFLPNGNNNFGKDHAETEYKAIPVSHDTGGTVSRVATGTGPLTWSHDGTPSGIWDLNGNVFEWQSGMRLVWGELQILANNDAADPDNPQNETSTCWKAINAADGSLVDPECATTDSAVKTSGRTVKIDWIDSVWTYSTVITAASSTARSCEFGSISCDESISEATKVLLKALALLPDSAAVDYYSDRVWIKNGAQELIICRGGNCMHGAGSGLFTMTADSDRTISGTNTGYRAAYIPNI